MLIHDVVAEFLLTQGDTEVRDYDIGRRIETLTHQIDGEPTPLSLQYHVCILNSSYLPQIDCEIIICMHSFPLCVQLINLSFFTSLIMLF